MLIYNFGMNKNLDMHGQTTILYNDKINAKNNDVKERTKNMPLIKLRLLLPSTRMKEVK